MLVLIILTLLNARGILSKTPFLSSNSPKHSQKELYKTIVVALRLLLWQSLYLNLLKEPERKTGGNLALLHNVNYMTKKDALDANKWHKPSVCL